MKAIDQYYHRYGYAVANHVFTTEEITKITTALSLPHGQGSNFRKSSELYAVRRFLQEFPDVRPLLFNSNLKQLIEEMFGTAYFVVKSIYFDKPPLSNWFVSYHQDLTISVDKKQELAGYGPWTVKQEQYAVQPPLALLQDNFTIRIHLDDTNRYNGALKVVAGSHLKNIYRPETIDWTKEKEHICDIQAGGVMLMSPLLLHASDRSIVNKRRRVVHLEFSRVDLPAPLAWSEKTEVFTYKEATVL